MDVELTRMIEGQVVDDDGGVWVIDDGKVYSKKDPDHAINYLPYYALLAHLKVQAGAGTVVPLSGADPGTAVLVRINAVEADRWLIHPHYTALVLYTDGGSTAVEALTENVAAGLLAEAHAS